ncbi:MAG: hypothetical protein KGL39_12735 [Patescibacteria group bacterium]|nr:hypothetical protein [Patescibacteria group bacterium]
MNIGDCYSLRWRYGHRIEATIVDVQSNAVVADCDHRCAPDCYLLRDYPSSLILSGRRTFLPREFAEQFEPMAQDAFALPPAITVELSI